MDDKRKMEIFENVKRFQKHAAMEAASRANSYVTTTDIPGGERIVVTTVLHELDCHGIGHAILNSTDRFDAEVSTLLSHGRAYLVLGEAMVKRGIHLSKQLNKIDEVAERAAERLLELLNSKVTDEHRHVVHLKRLEDGLRAGTVLKCDDCGEYFGIKGKHVQRRRPYYAKGLKSPRVTVRFFMCPHCFGWTRHPIDAKVALDAYNEFKKSQSHPVEKTGAPGSEPGPSVPNGTEGKAVNPQGDDGHSPPQDADIGGYRCPSCGEWYPSQAGDCGDPGHITAHSGPGDWSKAELLEAKYHAPELGYGDWPEGANPPLPSKGDDGQAPSLAVRPDWNPEWGTDLKDAANHGSVVAKIAQAPATAGQHVCGGTWQFDHLEQSETAEGPVYKCDKCGEFQVIFPKV
jgi:ssDNA-binding Zn-finger/Zn-ribbon topoisomerase 1